MLIEQYSDLIATMCAPDVCQRKRHGNLARRSAALRELPDLSLALAGRAETDIESVYAPDGTLLDPARYEIESNSGKLTLLATVGAAYHRDLYRRLSSSGRDAARAESGAAADDPNRGRATLART